MRLDKWVMAAALAIGAVLAGGQANALTVDCQVSQTKFADASVVPFENNTKTYTLDTALASAGCFSGATNGEKNDKNGIEDNPSVLLFGTTGWVFGGDFEDGGSTSGGADLAISLTGIRSTTDLPTWSLDLKGNSFEQIMITLKQDGNWAAFLIADTTTTVATLSGTWGTTGPGESVNDISHASVWYIGKTPGGGDPPGEIPLPAAGWLLVSVVAGIGVARRRMQRAS